MKAESTIRKGGSEKGIALLISIFILLLISVVAIALIVSSGTESALAGNYRSATSVYYAALSGLEEGRGRLLTRNPSSFNITASSLLPYLSNPPAAGNPPATASPIYILNPAPGENVVPWDPASVYPDNEFQNEFGFNPPSPSPSTNSVSTVAGIQGPLYKWVRINSVSEKSLNVDFDGNPSNSTIPVFYNSASPTKLNTTTTGGQVLEITSLAVLPNGSQKLLQYLVTPVPITLPPFLAALTLSDSPGAGNNATYHAPGSTAAYVVKGDDQDCSGTLTGVEHAAIGVFTGADALTGSSVLVGIQPGSKTLYTGLINPGPDVENISGIFPASLQNPSNLDAIVQTIIQNADAVVPAGSSATQTNYLTSLGMSPSNVMTVVANGDLDISNWTGTGYGLLLVTGTFTYDPSATWNGIILVIGQGIVGGNHLDFKQINGAVFVAKTRGPGPSFSLLPSLGGASVQFNDNMQGDGIRYSSCWIQKAQPNAGFKILSFHEIAQ